MVNQECNSSNSHFHIEISSIAYNWHSIDRVQFKFHQMEILFLFLGNFDQYFSFSTHFFNQKNWDKIRNFNFFGWKFYEFLHFCWKFSPIFLISQIFKREKPSLHRYLLLLTHSNQFHIIIFKLEENLSFG